jgi:hypothetical protein
MCAQTILAHLVEVARLVEKGRAPLSIEAYAASEEPTQLLKKGGEVARADFWREFESCEALSPHLPTLNNPY